MTAHNPFIMYKDITSNATRCDAHDLPLSSWTADVQNNSIPNYSFIAFNNTNDGHNGSGQAAEIRTGDAWLQSWLTPLINDSAIFSTTAFLITFDEDAIASHPAPPTNGSYGGHVYMVIVSPYSLGLTSDAFYNTTSLLTTAEWLLGIPGGTLANDSWARYHPMMDLFCFSSCPYTVTFKETGLPSRTSWSVTVGGAMRSSTSSTITFTEPNGKYGYTAAVAGSGNSTGSSFTVSGSKLTVPVAFYKTTFKEKGLANGSPWMVTANGTPQSSTASTTVSTIVFYFTDGSYSFTANATGYIATPSGGPLTVAGAKVWIVVAFKL
jgi:phospholipase C